MYAHTFLNPHIAENIKPNVEKSKKLSLSKYTNQSKVFQQITIILDLKTSRNNYLPL